MPITTQRLIIRLYTVRDYDHLRELDSDPVVLRYRSRKQISPKTTSDFLERALKTVNENPRLFFAYAIVLREGLEWLGQCGLTVIDPNAGEAFLWYSLLPRFWGRSYTPEAVRALIHVGFTEFNLKRIFAECHPENLPSVRVMQKAGLLDEGQVPFPGYPSDPTDRIRYGLLAGQYDPEGGKLLRVVRPL